MLSRIAESLFWLARYIERAEDTARILDVNYHMMLEQSQQSYQLRWDPLIIMAGEEVALPQVVRQGRCRKRLRVSRFPAGQSKLHRPMHRESPRKCPHYSRLYLARNVGRH